MTESLYVTESSLPPFDEYVETIRPLWENRILSNRGQLTRKLEQELRRYLDISHIWLTASGHIALETMIEAMDFPPKSEVITTAFTFCSTVHAIVRSGLTPVLVDIDPQTLTIDPIAVENAISENTSAILATHVYGFPCEVHSLESVARQHKLALLYDGAHAFGVTKGASSIANYGDATAFSTHATKMFHTIEGGIIAWSDDNLMRNLSFLTNYGLDENHDSIVIGTNAHMSEFAAAMGICNLRHLEEYRQRREAIVHRYWELLDGLAGISLVLPPADSKWNYAYLPVLLSNRSQVEKMLAREGIIARRYFFPSIDRLRCYAGMFNGANLPFAHRCANEVLCLPLSSEMSLQDAERVCSIIRSCK